MLQRRTYKRKHTPKATHRSVKPGQVSDETLRPARKTPKQSRANEGAALRMAFA